MSIDFDLNDLSSPNPRVKYGCAKNLVSIAEESPQVQYPHLDFFVALLDSPNLILMWTAIDVLGALAVRIRTAR